MAPAAALLRPAAARGRLLAGGMDARHAFSRGDAIDRAWMGWGALRVLSTQGWAPGAVGEPARIANMELVMLVLDGRLRIACAGLGVHEVAAGGVAWIGAGHGIEYRLANASAAAPLRLVEAWIQPDRVNAAPDLAILPRTTAAPEAWSVLAAGGAFVHAASCIGADGLHADVMQGRERARGPLPLRQDAQLRLARIGPGATLALDCAPGRRGWLQLLEGDAVTDGQLLSAGDGLAWGAGTAAPGLLAAAAGMEAHALLVELPA